MNGDCKPDTGSGFGAARMGNKAYFERGPNPPARMTPHN